MYQESLSVIDWSDIFAPSLIIFMMIILIILMVFFRMKSDKFTIILVIEMFSVIIGGASVYIETFPLNPYFQLFFIVFQSVIFFKDAIDTFYN